MQERLKQFIKAMLSFIEIILAVLIIGILGALWQTGIWGMIISALMAIFLVRSLSGKNEIY